MIFQISIFHVLILFIFANCPPLNLNMTLTTNLSTSSSLFSFFILSDFSLLLWKHFLIQFRHPFQSVVEIVVPCFLVLLISIFRSSVEVTIYNTPIIYDAFNFNETFNRDHTQHYLIMYTPNTEQNSIIMKQTIEQLENVYFSINFNSK